jgi:hypothetical protein
MFSTTCTVFLEKNFSTKLVPDRTFWKNTTQEVILPTLSGQMGVLTNHVRHVEHDFLCYFMLKTINFNFTFINFNN